MKSSNVLGKVYQDGEVIFREGDVGDWMFVIQEGQVEVLGEFDGQEVRLAVSKAGEVIGEMAIFERQTRSATVRALGKRGCLRLMTKRLYVLFTKTRLSLTSCSKSCRTGFAG